MKSRFITDPYDTSGDGVLNTAGDGVDPNFFPAPFLPMAGHADGSPSVSAPPANSPTLTPTLPPESVEAQAAVSGSSAGGVGSVVAETSGNGITFNLIFDAAAMAAPQSFRDGIEQAASILSATITNKITVNINIDYSGTGGGAAAGPDNGVYESYSTVRSELISHAAAGDTTFNALPTGTTIEGQSQVAVWNGQLKLWGLLGANDTTTDDGSATFATDIQSSLLVGVALHELTHALGRVPYGPPSGSQPDIFDLFRFTSAGTQLINGASTAPAAYFSVDGGHTKIADYGQTSDPSDFLNSGVQGGNDPFNEFYTFSTLQSLTVADKEQLDALGFNTIGILVPATASQAVQGGARVTLLSGLPNITDPAHATLSSATIKIANAGGSAVTGDQLAINGVQNGSVGSGVAANWNATTDTLTLTGSASLAVYDTLLSEVSYQDTGTDSSSGSHPVRTVTWTVNDGTNTYNTTSQIAIDRVPVANNDVAADAVGSTVTTTATSGLLSNDTDLDSDTLTVIGISDPTHGAGSVGASLAGVYGHLTFNADGSYSYVADNSSAINIGPTGSHLQDVFTYSIGDGNGGTAAATLTITLDRPPVVTAANVALGAGQTSVAVTSLFTASDPDGNTITTDGFMDTGNGHFVLNGVVQTNNQEIDVTAAQLSQLTYQSVPGSTADALEVRVNDGTLWSNWTSFTVTAPPLVIESFGSTKLDQIGSDYFFDPVTGAAGTGPELKYAGAPLAAGTYGPWTILGAEQTSSGYDVAFKANGADQYTVWATDSSGNYVSSLVINASGTSTALESIETTFHQDLNGDGTIGPPPPPPPPPPPTAIVIESFGSTKLDQIGSDYFFDPVTGAAGTGPELKYAGAPLAAGTYGPWTILGAEQTSSGYDVAFKANGADQYTVWATDSSGNYVSSLIINASGTSTALESIETTFHQDLNGDGTIGPPPPPPPPPPPTAIVIESFGSTKLDQIGSDYFFDPVTGAAGTGPELKYAGAPLAAGTYGPWTILGAEQTSSGYDVAFKANGADQYTVWATDSSGNYVSSLVINASGTSTALESIETTFHQDLNGDGTIGPPPPPPPPPPPTAIVIESFGSTKLDQIGSDYFFDPVTGAAGTGPELKYAGAPLAAGTYGPWTILGAEQTSSGYDVAFKANGADQYTVWATDSSGNYVSSLVINASGTSAALESIETVFHQDLNGDGVIGLYAAPSTTLQISTPLAGTSGSATIGTGATLELAAADSASVTFSNLTGMLKLDTPSTFSGLIFNFAGTGSLPGSDQIDLKGVNFNAVHDSYANGVLTVTDGTNTAALNFNGSYTLANFKFASDGSGGTIVYDPPTSSQSSPEGGAASNTAGPATATSDLFVTAVHDSFVFGPNFGQVTIADFNPASNTIQLSKTVFANLDAVMAATHDDGHGNAVITDAGHDTITIQHVTTAQLLAHQGDFHFVI